MLIAWFLRRAFRLRRDSRQLASYRPILAARSAVGTRASRAAFGRDAVDALVENCVTLSCIISLRYRTAIECDFSSIRVLGGSALPL